MENLIHGEMTVKQVLETHPQTIPVFIEMKTLCVGCPLEQFCTLEEVALAYKIPSDLLLDKLCASTSIRSRRNA